LLLPQQMLTAAFNLPSICVEGILRVRTLAMITVAARTAVDSYMSHTKYLCGGTVSEG
jgi:hypothetical protein